MIRLTHPPMPYAPTRREEFRLLSFGRLLPYKVLDLLADCLRRLGPQPGLVVRVVGSGPESPEVLAPRGLSSVTVENRWVPEHEVGMLLGWGDAIILSHREASQSGVAAVALAARRYVVATNVGGLTEQLADEPLAILCEPDADSLVKGLRYVLSHPLDMTTVASIDPRAAWRELGQSLLKQIQPLLQPDG